MGQRGDNWPTVLKEELEKPRTFVWGECDCCQFAFSVVRSITGARLGAEPLGHYDGPISAHKWLFKNNYRSIRDWVMAMCAEHGFQEISPQLAQRGDLVMVAEPDGQKMGVMDDGLGAFLGVDGQQIEVPRDKLLTAWRVG